MRISDQPLDQAALDAKKGWYPPDQQRRFVLKGF
jgi:hypothetical protein